MSGKTFQILIFDETFTYFIKPVDSCMNQLLSIFHEIHISSVSYVKPSSRIYPKLFLWHALKILFSNKRRMEYQAGNLLNFLMYRKPTVLRNDQTCLRATGNTGVL